MRQPNFQQMTRREIEDYMIERSLVDPEFRARLIENPREAVSGLGLPVGADVKIQVLVEGTRLVLHRTAASPAGVA